MTKKAPAVSRALKDESGMTLLEILIVMVILALLGTLGGLQLVGYLGRAKVDIARLQIREITTALELFKIDVGRAPSSGEGLPALLERPASSASWRGPYLRKESNLVDPWGRRFVFRSPGEHGEYDLVSLGADGQPGGEGENGDVGNWQDK